LGSSQIPKSVTASQTVKVGHTIVKAVYVTKSGASGSKAEFRDGTLDTDLIVFTVEGEAVQSLPNIDGRFANGVRVTVTTGGSYLVVYE